MSRIIIKNLPSSTTSEKVKEAFSQFGTITDIQLKYTKAGKFRKFGFVGYETSEEAASACKNLNNTFFGLSKIHVELCAELGDPHKPKAWSKYALDSSAYKKLQEKEITNVKSSSLLEKKQDSKGKKSYNAELVEIVKKYKDEPEFLEYMELHGKGEKIQQILVNISKDTEENSMEEEEEEEEVETTAQSLAHSAISDMEYLKFKKKNQNPTELPKIEEPDKEIKPASKVNLFTIKIQNLPYKVKKKNIKEIFSPVVPASVRLAKNIKGIAFVGFKTEKDLRKALIKHKSFYSGKQLSISEHKNKSSADDKPQRWKQQEESLKNEECIAESGRIFIRNLAYSVTEKELEELFSKYGSLTEVILPVDKTLRKIRGYAVVTFLIPEHAVKAFTELDGTVFHGRMLHLIPGKAKESLEDVEDEEGGSYKLKKLKKLKATSSSAHNWNTLFLDLNAVAELVAKKFNISKEEVLTGSNAAVRLAFGETQVVSETRKFLEENGVHLDVFNQIVESRSKTTILVKNLPAHTTVSEIRDMFSKFGILNRVVLPPSGITGIVEFIEPSEARAAFRKLAYSKFKHIPLYLEWAPENTFTSTKQVKADRLNEDEGELDVAKSEMNSEAKSANPVKDSDDSEDESLREVEPNTTLFIKNLNFNTTDEDLRKHFEVCGSVVSAQVSKKKDLSKPGSFLSMGYGFVQYYLQSSATEALKKLQGSLLEGHALEIKRSNKTLSVTPVIQRKGTNVRNQTGKKIVVRNIPFQATAREIRQLFQVFGELNFVRLPLKMVGTGSHRGFAFVEFQSKKSAKNAMKALCQSTHLFGRRLVLEWAKEDEGIEELRKRTAQHFHKEEESKKHKKAVADISVENDAEEEEDLQF